MMKDPAKDQREGRDGQKPSVLPALLLFILIAVAVLVAAAWMGIGAREVFDPGLSLALQKIHGPEITPTPALPVPGTLTPAPSPRETQTRVVRQALFNVSPGKGRVPLRVRFTDLSTGSPSSWLWDFGNGMTSAQQNPEYRYEQPGGYTVRLQSMYPDGSWLGATGTVTVLAPLTAKFLVGIGENRLTRVFTDKSSGEPVSWEWDFGDGTVSTLPSPTHRYASEGVYPVSLTVTGDDWTVASTSDMVTVGPPLRAHFEYRPATGEPPLQVWFTDMSSGNPNSWFWDFGDGYTSVDRDPVHTYTRTGTYYIRMTVTTGSESDSATGQVTVRRASWP